MKKSEKLRRMIKKVHECACHTGMPMPEIITLDKKKKRGIVHG